MLNSLPGRPGKEGPSGPAGPPGRDGAPGVEEVGAEIVDKPEVRSSGDTSQSSAGEHSGSSSGTDAGDDDDMGVSSGRGVVSGGRSSGGSRSRSRGSEIHRAARRLDDAAKRFDEMIDTVSSNVGERGVGSSGGISAGTVSGGEVNHRASIHSTSHDDTTIESRTRRHDTGDEHRGSTRHRRPGVVPRGTSPAPPASKPASRPQTPSQKEQYSQSVKQAVDLISAAYPDWARSTAGSLKPYPQQGEWNPSRGPPYMPKTAIMFAGAGVDQVGVGTLISQVLGLHFAAGRKCDLRSCDHAMVGNQFVKSFDGAQWRFGYRTTYQAIVIPPLRAAGPILGGRGLYRLHHWLVDGHNTLVVGGGTANIAFINGNCMGPNGGYNLEEDRVDGPFEAQAAVINSPFEGLPASLEGPNQAVVGVKKSSLPAEAISYYEMDSASVLFEIPTGTGRIVYLAYEFKEPARGWVKALLAATSSPHFVPH